MIKGSHLSNAQMKILDATASNRSIWYQKNNPFTVFLDKRCGKEYMVTENSNFDNNCVIRVFPDVQAIWQHLPFIDNSFDMVVFDPPHLFKDKGTKLSLISKRYGVFYNHSWKQELSEGIIELFRVLKPQGIFMLKWNEAHKPVEGVLKLFPYPPLFGSRTGKKNNTHWITFMKYSFNHTLEDYEN